MRHNAVRNCSLLLASLAVGASAVACSPRTEQPAETTTAPAVSPSEKAVRTNVTKSPALNKPQPPSTNCHDPRNSINCVIPGGPAAGEVTPN
jgi:hypothetical protein